MVDMVTLLLEDHGSSVILSRNMCAPEQSAAQRVERIDLCVSTNGSVWLACTPAPACVLL